ncbi:AarF/UbiB family protein [uncultured Algimonas sp.]|uniref:ABC1 kinase family protein n=1 Tax=uncultured Algimonas sp. TaxID=1547920 RepID=UPI002611BED0|nr:AarF/UbiB family protein [uncultured Algimonas sp.]
MLRRTATFFRLLRTGWVLVRHDALVPKEYEPFVPGPVRFVAGVSRFFSIRDRDDNPGARFANALEKLGPAYIKFGQILSTRGDMFDPVFAEGLSRLKDKVPPFPMEKAEAMLEADWGEPWRGRLSSLSEPVAAASVAQVHKGVLRESGETVAIKILRPNIVARMTRDMDVIRQVANLAHAAVPAVRRLQPRAFVAEARRAVMLELDLRLEAAAASEMADIATATGLFRVPAIHWEMVDKNVMATDWVNGTAFSSPDILALPIEERRELATAVIQSFLASTFTYGIFHADMHEGNLFRDPDGNLVLLDFGILGRLGDEEIRFEIDTLYGFLQRDYYKIAQVHFDIGYVPPHHSVDEFATALRAVGEPIFGKAAEDVSMSKVLLQLLEITEMFDMPLQPQLILLQKTMMQAEGVARRLDPHFDMWEASRPIVEDAVRAELGPERYLNDLLDGLDRTRRTLVKLPDATENIARLAEAWANGEIDLSRAPIVKTVEVRKPGWLRPAGYAAIGAAIALGGAWTLGQL